MREICTYGSVRGEGGNILTYSALRTTRYALRPTPYALRPTRYALRTTRYARKKFDVRRRIAY